MLSVEVWAEIRRLHRSERLPIKAIARVLGVSWNTVRVAIASDVPPNIGAYAGGSLVDVLRAEHLRDDRRRSDGTACRRMPPTQG